MKFSIKDLRIWSYLVKKFLMENFIFLYNDCNIIDTNR